MILIPTRAAITLLFALPVVFAQKRENVLVVANDNSSLSRRIAEYYIRRREIPLKNYCHIRTTAAEEIDRATFERDIEKGVGACLKNQQGPITAIVLTQGVPLKIRRALADGWGTDGASVDSELAVFYRKVRGQRYPVTSFVPNPYFRQQDAFDQRRFPMYLVARLAVQTPEDVQRMIDDSLAVSKNTGRAAQAKAVIDLKSLDDTSGNDWLRNAAIALPKERVVFDESLKVVEGVKDVVAYAGWGSNDPARKKRMLGLGWVPGSVATEFVSTDARSFGRPPASWTLGSWSKPETFFAGSPQSLTSDYLAEGASAATGHVYEPFLQMSPRPDYLLPAYLLKGRTLGEAYYSSVPGLSWQNVLVGDPLMSLRGN